MLLDVRHDHLVLVQAILRAHVPDRDVWAFGSRSKWQAKDYSDLDLCIVGDTPLDFKVLGRLDEEFSESDLPYKVDVLDWAITSTSFQKIIERDKVIIQKKKLGISSEWPVLPLEECLDALIDYRGKTPMKTESGVPLVTAKVIKAGRIETPTEFIAHEDFDVWMRRGMPKPGDIVMTTEAPLGEVAQLGHEKVALAQRVITLRGKDGFLDNDYLLYLMMSEDMQEQLKARATGTTVLGIKQSELRKISVKVPPLDIQKSAASTLKALDDRIALLRETNATLEAMAQALFKSWFVDFDPVHANAGTKQMINPASSPSDFVGDPAAPLDSRLRGNDDLLPPELQTLFPATFTASPQGLVPEGWEWLALDEAYELNPKRNLKKGALAKYLDMASVGTSGHTAESAINREFGSGTKFINGDTLLARITPCLENGKTAFVDFLEEDETGWGSTEFIVMRPKVPLPAYHAYLLARFPVFREFAIQSMSGTSGRQRVQNDVLGRYMLAVPDSAVAELFGQTIEAMQQKIAANHQQAQTLATLRDTLLPRLISGQLRLPDAEAALAEVVV
jgi:type I restriction enzyme S subunit